ncbi:MAG TPA: helix-turn-helix domain-containing protein [Xanthobacteraceae bacterium]|nr:helix-turn-helix domain-containing protein [Xanthobacteraceae bacterium]
MSDSLALIRFLERVMPKPYAVDFRGRVINDVETGASRREAAERYGISPSVVVIWMQRFEEREALRQNQVAAADHGQDDQYQAWFRAA